MDFAQLEVIRRLGIAIFEDVGPMALLHAAKAVAVGTVLWMQWRVAADLTRNHPFWKRPAVSWLLAAGWALSCFLLTFTVVLTVPRFFVLLPFSPDWAWWKAAGVSWALFSTFLVLLYWLRGRVEPHFEPSRRAILEAACLGVAAAPLTAAGFGILVGRRQFGLREVELRIRNLPKGLNGLRIAQLSDIHMGPFLSGQELAWNVDMANETKPHLAVVTGDLISGHGDPLDECLVRLTRLKADAGIYACLGNHEIYAEAEKYAQRRGAELGIAFLRRQARSLRFGGSTLNLSGVDYQRKALPYLEKTEKLIQPGSLNVLMSHNPDVFPVAAEKGFDVTLAGHTHGGQVSVEILHQHVNWARFFTPFIHGHYTIGNSHLYVTRGIGTVAIPVRVGAPPEVTLVKLCAI